MRNCQDPATPCHRVIGAGGALALKRALLRAERLDVGVARVRNFAQARWKPASRT
jgi:alkylated DNA nucleotide flippase Atl1